MSQKLIFTDMEMFTVEFKRMCLIWRSPSTNLILLIKSSTIARVLCGAQTMQQSNMNCFCTRHLISVGFFCWQMAVMIRAVIMRDEVGSVL